MPEPIDELTPSAAVELALTTVARYRRPDLEGRLRQARARLDDGHVRVLVVGEFKQGKSLLVNGLVGAPVCPVRDDVATSVATVVSHAPQPAITLRARVQGPDGRSTVRPVQRTEVPVAAMAEALAGYVTERGNPGNRRGLAEVEARLPCRLLAGGLQIVDTPGVGGLRSLHGAATMAALPTADAVLLVSDASQEYTAPELEFLRQAIRLCPNVVCVAHEDRHVPGVAPDRRARRRAPARRGDRGRPDSRLVDLAAGRPWTAVTRRSTPSPASRTSSATSSSGWPVRPTSWPAARPCTTCWP